MRSKLQCVNLRLIEDDLSEGCVSSGVPGWPFNDPDFSFFALARSVARSHDQDHLCGRERVPIPHRIPTRNIFVPVRLNGSRPLSFALDTGSTRMLVDRTLAKSLGLKPTGQGSLQGAGAGRIPIEFVPNVGIGFPGLESTGYEFSTADLQPLEASLGVNVDGILGDRSDPVKNGERTVCVSARSLRMVPSPPQPPATQPAK
jgi:hypothetical protein